MSETKEKALEKLLSEIDELDLFKPLHSSDSELVDECAAVMRSFLENPERHEKHAAVIVEYTMLASSVRVFDSFFSVFKGIPFAKIILRKTLGKLFESMLFNPLKSKISAARNEILSLADPGNLNIDLLHITTFDTKDDWKAHGKRLILIETRGAAFPTKGMKLSAMSHSIEIISPSGCQLVDSAPSNEMEVLGAREISVEKTGKFVRTENEESKVSGEMTAGLAKLSTSIGYKGSISSERESSKGEKISHSRKVIKVISSAVGSNAMWQLMRTPTQPLLGTNRFSATVLIPADTIVLKHRLRFGVEIES